MPMEYHLARLGAVSNGKKVKLTVPTQLNPPHSTEFCWQCFHPRSRELLIPNCVVLPCYDVLSYSFKDEHSSIHCIQVWLKVWRLWLDAEEEEVASNFQDSQTPDSTTVSNWQVGSDSKRHGLQTPDPYLQDTHRHKRTIFCIRIYNWNI